MANNIFQVSKVRPYVQYENSPVPTDDRTSDSKKAAYAIFDRKHGTWNLFYPIFFYDNDERDAVWIHKPDLQILDACNELIDVYINNK